MEKVLAKVRPWHGLLKGESSLYSVICIDNVGITLRIYRLPSTEGKAYHLKYHPLFQHCFRVISYRPCGPRELSQAQRLARDQPDHQPGISLILYTPGHAVLTATQEPSPSPVNAAAYGTEGSVFCEAEDSVFCDAEDSVFQKRAFLDSALSVPLVHWPVFQPHFNERLSCQPLPAQILFLRSCVSSNLRARDQ